MIYELGRRLQTTDFTDDVAARNLIRDLRENLNLTAGDCTLCLLYAHSKHEEKDFFRPLRTFDPDVVKLMMVEHREIVEGIHHLSQTGDELLAETSPPRRIEVGDRLNLEANDLFAFYLRHMNNEEATMVPVMWEHFTDKELRALRSQFHTSVPRRRLEAWMRWTLPALNPNELVVFFRGMREDGPSELCDYLVGLAAETVDADRWEWARNQAGV
jgi:hemerythrin HHE cation binding domain-containing protein